MAQLLPVKETPSAKESASEGVGETRREGGAGHRLTGGSGCGYIVVVVDDDEDGVVDAKDELPVVIMENPF